MKVRREGKLEWFGGNEDALRMLNAFADLAHIWDDITAVFRMKYCLCGSP